MIYKAIKEKMEINDLGVLKYKHMVTIYRDKVYKI